MEFTHLAFSDDSKHQDGQYNSLALITLENKNFEVIKDEIKNIYEESGVEDEFKWEKLRTAKYRLAAQKIIKYIFINNENLRVDILIWNLNDSRHKNVIRRDDSENLVRMYYHLVSTTCSMKWPIKGSFWKWCPDLQSSVDWSTLQNCISNKRHPCVQDLFENNPDFMNVNLEEIEPISSSNMLLIQIADLFAGMGAYSWGHYERYSKWKNDFDLQLSLFSKQKKIKLSLSEKERFTIISDFNLECKKRKLQISLKSTKGLKSYNPNCFINFWLYEPQHSMDKAPSGKKYNKI